MSNISSQTIVDLLKNINNNCILKKCTMKDTNDDPIENYLGEIKMYLDLILENIKNTFPFGKESLEQLWNLSEQKNCNKFSININTEFQNHNFPTIETNLKSKKIKKKGFWGDSNPDLYYSIDLHKNDIPNDGNICCSSNIKSDKPCSQNYECIESQKGGNNKSDESVVFYSGSILTKNEACDEVSLKFKKIFNLISSCLILLYDKNPLLNEINSEISDTYFKKKINSIIEKKNDDFRLKLCNSNIFKGLHDDGSPYDIKDINAYKFLIDYFDINDDDILDIIKEMENPNQNKSLNEKLDIQNVFGTIAAIEPKTIAKFAENMVAGKNKFHKKTNRRSIKKIQKRSKKKFKQNGGNTQDKKNKGKELIKELYKIIPEGIHNTNIINHFKNTRFCECPANKVRKDMKLNINEKPVQELIEKVDDLKILYLKEIHKNLKYLFQNTKSSQKNNLFIYCNSKNNYNICKSRNNIDVLDKHIPFFNLLINKKLKIVKINDISYFILEGNIDPKKPNQKEYLKCEILEINDILINEYKVDSILNKNFEIKGIKFDKSIYNDNLIKKNFDSLPAKEINLICYPIDDDGKINVGQHNQIKIKFQNKINWEWKINFAIDNNILNKLEQQIPIDTTEFLKNFENKYVDIIKFINNTYCFKENHDRDNFDAECIPVDEDDILANQDNEPLIEQKNDNKIVEEDKIEVEDKKKDLYFKINKIRELLDNDTIDNKIFEIRKLLKKNIENKSPIKNDKTNKSVLDENKIVKEDIIIPSPREENKKEIINTEQNNPDLKTDNIAAIDPDQKNPLDIEKDNMRAKIPDVAIGHKLVKQVNIDKVGESKIDIDQDDNKAGELNKEIEKNNIDEVSPEQREDEVLPEQKRDEVVDQYNNEVLPEQKRDEVVDQYNNVVSPEQKRDEVVDQYNNEVSPEQREDEVLPEQKRDEVVDQYNNEVSPEQKRDEVVDQYNNEVSPEQREDEVLPEQKRDEVLPEQKRDEVVDQYNNKVLPEEREEEFFEKDNNNKVLPEEREEEFFEKDNNNNEQDIETERINIQEAKYNDEPLKSQDEYGTDGIQDHDQKISGGNFWHHFGGSRMRNKSLKKFQKKRKKSRKYQRGGISARPGTLCLKCPNMDCGPPFHPIWGEEYCNRDENNLEGGIKNKKKKNMMRKKIKTKKKNRKRQDGGISARPGTLCLKSPNMDCGPPFHPIWGEEYCNRDVNNLEGGIKNKKKKNMMRKKVKTKKKNRKRQDGGISARPGTLCLKCPNMDCGPPFHPIWGEEYCNRDVNNLEGGIKNKKKKNMMRKKIKTKKKNRKRQDGGISARPGTLCLKCPNMDCGPPFHPIWGEEYCNKNLDV